MGLSQTVSKKGLDMEMWQWTAEVGEVGSPNKKVGRGCFPTSGGNSEKGGVRSLGEVGILPLSPGSIGYGPTQPTLGRAPCLE